MKEIDSFPYRRKRQAYYPVLYYQLLLYCSNSTENYVYSYYYMQYDCTGSQGMISFQDDISAA